MPRLFWSRKVDIFLLVVLLAEELAVEGSLEKVDYGAKPCLATEAPGIKHSLRALQTLAVSREAELCTFSFILP